LSPTDEQPKTRLDTLREKVAADPTSARAHFRLGTALLLAQHHDEAEQHLRKAVELDTELAEAWVNLGGLLFSRFDFEGSREANAKAVECSPNSANAHYNLGLSHLYLNNADEMVICFRRVIEIEPQHPGGQYHLAVGLHAQGHTEEARDRLALAMRLGYAAEPQFVKALEPDEAPQVPVFEIGKTKPTDDPQGDSGGGSPND